MYKTGPPDDRRQHKYKYTCVTKRKEYAKQQQQKKKIKYWKYWKAKTVCVKMNEINVGKLTPGHAIQNKKERKRKIVEMNAIDEDERIDEWRTAENRE